MAHGAMSEKMMHEVLRCIDEGIHVVGLDGITLYYNPVAARLDGMDVEEVIGMHVLDAFPSLTRKTSTLLKVIDTGEPIYNQQQTYHNRYGKRIVTINTTLPLRVNGHLVGAVEVSKDITRIKELSETVIELQTQIREPGRRRVSKIRQRYRFEQILTQNERMMREIARAKKAAATDSPVLVVGETGTGKELMVQSIHHASPRGKQSLIAQNCAAIPSALLEGILFGTVKGAFTGAEDRPGLFELADGGTMFLDEIQAMPLDLQAKLLRVLEEGVVRRVGDTRVRPVDVRILAATNEDPLESVKEGRLRKDLYYRLHVVRITLPPLRERREDLPLLTAHFIRKYNDRLGTDVIRVAPEVERLFARYDWPGNVRELEHTIEGAINMVEGKVIGLEHLPPYMLEGADDGPFVDDVQWESGQSLRDVLNQVEERLIRRAMADCRGNMVQAAKRLGIPRQTLQYRIKKLGIERP
ncbi:sigma 54-interacting transcriptional regulator [Polycladomyces sp. WAk]|uniref:Sigma 54-interacting transcriptional regulator n=1 Tax=Polycladomyces zharkentensis TaxID=2807616 RepID=A0ABS2WFL5_9BACL|nr:sigma 54-interacting transcriptional regulator [Polycladomyces sp. WAk]MBN2908100.1 sigma 54-interacting transcriptional regulator [Polycladomyces sp. WAk]